MVPNKFNIVDFGGFDVTKDSGQKVVGIYDKLIDANWNCVYTTVFGLTFGSTRIPPYYAPIRITDTNIFLDDTLKVYRDDSVDVIIAIPPPPVLYGKIHFMIGEVEVYSELVESGSVISHTAYYGGKFYYAEAELQEADTYVEMSELQTKYSIVQLTLVPTLVVKENNNVRIRSSSGTGIILSSESESSVRARWVVSNYRQVGNCRATARFPDVVTSGIGRGSFSSPNNNTDFTLTKTSEYPHLYIGYVGGVSELLIYNFFN